MKIKKNQIPNGNKFGLHLFLIKNNMKNNIVFAILIVALFFSLMFLALYTKNNFKRLEKQIAIESAKANFNRDATFDSVIVKRDTILFYKNGEFMGKSVTMTIE